MKLNFLWSNKRIHTIYEIEHQEELEEKIDYDEVRKREELILSEQELESFP